MQTLLPVYSKAFGILADAGRATQLIQYRPPRRLRPAGPASRAAAASPPARSTLGSSRTFEMASMASPPFSSRAVPYTVLPTAGFGLSNAAVRIGAGTDGSLRPMKRAASAVTPSSFATSSKRGASGELGARVLRHLLRFGATELVADGLHDVLTHRRRAASARACGARRRAR